MCSTVAHSPRYKPALPVKVMTAAFVDPHLDAPASAHPRTGGRPGASARSGACPNTPQTPYYRTYETSVDADAHLFEFVVPMVPPSWNDPDQVREYAHRLGTSARPTAVAVSILDVCQPADAQGRDYYSHWALTHLLLDGHHIPSCSREPDFGPAALSLLSLEASLAAPDQLSRLIDVRSRRRVSRRQSF
jgi:hypothetical protein